MLKFLIIILICNFSPWVTSQDVTPDPRLHGPRKPPWPNWVEGLAVQHLVNMTEELVKDVVLKLKHAEKIRRSHGVSISFELGSVAAGIQERFYRMLNIYRKYANTNDFKSQRWQVWEVFKAYQIVQGDYHEIRNEKALYHEIVRRHESTTRNKHWLLSKYTTTRGGRRQGLTWRPYSPSDAFEP